MGRVIDGTARFNDRRIAGFYQIRGAMAKAGYANGLRVKELEATADGMIKELQAKAYAILAPHRMELAPLMKDCGRDTPVLELIYYFGDIPGPELNLIFAFLRRHKALVEESISVWWDGIVRLQAWIREQDWPKGYDKNKLSYGWHQFYYGIKPTINRLLELVSNE